MNAIRKLALNEPQMLFLVLTMTLIGVAGTLFVFFVQQIVDVGDSTDRNRPHIQWLVAAPGHKVDGPALDMVAEMLDPTVTALPSVQGFSRDMWMHAVASKYRSEVWTSEPAFLQTEAPATVPELLDQQPLVDSVWASAVKLPADTGEPAGEVMAMPVVLDKSVMQISGPLANRALLSGAELPKAVSDTPLRPTRLRVGVAGDGVVRYAMVERTSGDDKADAQAVQFIRQARFEPLQQAVPSPGTWIWGLVRVFWATELPVQPNNGTAGNKTPAK